MKKILALLLVCILIFTLTACGGGTNEPTGNEDVQSGEVNEQLPVASTKTLAYFQKFLSGGEYTMEMQTTAEGMTVSSKNVYKGEMIYTESEFNGTKSCMIMKDGYQYIIDHSTKTCMKMQLVDNTAVMDMFADEAENYQAASATGTTELNGKTYEYEEFALGEETVQYLFEGDELKIIKANVMGTESLVEIIAIQKGADASLFEVPEDYQVIAY